jgi:hypothetical protein
VVVKFAKVLAHFAVAIGLLDSDSPDDDREELKQVLMADAEKAVLGDQVSLIILIMY